MSTFRFVAQSAPIGLSAESAPIRIRVTGAQGPAGPAGPNTITTSTTTNLTGFISGNGTNVNGATAATAAATANTLVLRNARGGGVFFNESADDSTTVEISNSGAAGSGVSISANYVGAFISGDYVGAAITGGDVGASINGVDIGVEIFGELGLGAVISSSSGIGANIYTDSGEYHASFGTQGINHSFVARVKGSIGWFRNDELTARIHPVDTITDNRTYTLPDASGTVALTTDITNSVTSATTSDGTASLDILDLVVGGEGIGLTGNYSSLSTVGDYGTITTTGEFANISTVGNEASITTNGENASIVTSGTNASIRTEGSNASIYTEGEGASIFTSGANAYMQSGSFRLFDGNYTTTLSHSPTDDRAIAFPDADGTVALTTDIPTDVNNITSATTSDGTAELSLASLEAGSRDGLIIRNSDGDQVAVIGKDNSIDGESGTISGAQFGSQTAASGNHSFAIGAGTTASGDYSYASGANTIASAAYSHAEGNTTTASGLNSHAEGDFTTASGGNSHAEGSNTTASGLNSHAGGLGSTASGDTSYAQGTNAKAIHDGASVESDSQNADVESTAIDEKTFRFASGYRFLGGSATFDAGVTVTGTLTADHIHGNLAGSVYAHVRAGETLAKGDPVYISGSHGTAPNLIPIVSKADASNAAKMPAVGIMDAALANNASGHMVITGTITELNTNAYAVNSVLYVATGGGFTATPPAANSQPVAIVERANTNNGAVIVKVNGLASSGGNGVSDANKLVRFTSTGTIPVASIGGLGTGVATALAVNTGSAGAIVVNGGTATNMTYAGSAAFTSTTRPTSAGTGTPAATSLITRGDLSMEIMRQVGQVQFLQTSAMNYSSASGGSAAQGVDGIALNSGTTASAYARVAMTRQLSTAPGLTGSASACNVPVAFAFSGFCIGPSDINSVLRFVVGEVGTGAPALASANALSARGWGFEIYWSVANSRVECRMFAHDGTTYTTSSAVAITTVSSLDRYNTFLATSDGSGVTKLFHAGSTGNTAPLRPSDNPVLTHTSPNSGIYGQPWTSLLCVNSASTAASPTILRIPQVRLHIGQIY